MHGWLAGWLNTSSLSVGRHTGCRGSCCRCRPSGWCGGQQQQQLHTGGSSRAPMHASSPPPSRLRLRLRRPAGALLADLAAVNRSMWERMDSQVCLACVWCGVCMWCGVVRGCLVICKWSQGLARPSPGGRRNQPLHRWHDDAASRLAASTACLHSLAASTLLALFASAHKSRASL